MKVMNMDRVKGGVTNWQWKVKILQEKLYLLPFCRAELYIQFPGFELSCGFSGEKPVTRHIGCGVNCGLTPCMWLWCMGKCYRKFRDYARAWVTVLIFFVEIILRDVCQKYRIFFPPKLSEGVNFSTEDKPLHAQCTLLACACSIRSAGRRER